MKTTRVLYVLTALALCTTATAQQRERTSENTPTLQKMLEKRPETDLNKDGVLTLEEVKQSRQQQKKQPAQKIQPAYTDIRYGDHEAMALDFWPAESDTPTPLFIWIHGGGFRAGDKNSVNPILLEEFLKAGVSVAAINYRLTDVGPYPLQMNDSARAVQFLRSKAGEWNLDASRFAAGGGSAGSGISQWLAFHDDMADPDSDDLVARQSTRLTCALPINMQSTYDPRVIKEIIPGITYKNSALLPFYGLPDGWNWNTDPIDAELDALIKDASPINHLTDDDPPVFMLHFQGAAKPGNIHHPDFGIPLKESMDKLGIECVRRMDSDYPSKNDAYRELARFVVDQFKRD